MPRLLLIAPTCDGEDVGEAWVAHQWARRLAASHDVTLLTYHKAGHPKASRQLTGLRVVEWSEPPGFGRAERLNSMLKPAYVPFYFRARHWVRQALRRGERFDIAHQPVPVAMRYPSPVSGLGIPYVIGPVGGSLDSPAGFDDEEGTSPWYVGLRRMDRMRIRRDPLLRATYERATCVLGIADYVAEFLAGLRIRRFEVMSETGIDGLVDPVDRTGTTSPVTLLYVGRLVRTKGARDAIRAMACLSDLPVVLEIVGDGFDRRACESLVSELALGQRVRFRGWLPHAQVEDFYRSADIFVFPSYREPGGNVAFEAMSFGLPLIVADRGGPGAAVDDASGIRLHPVSPETFASDVADAVRLLVTDPARRLAMGAAARRRVAETAVWDRKVARVTTLYEQILANPADWPRTTPSR